MAKLQREDNQGGDRSLPEPFQSGGMMQAPELAAEADALRAEYAANLAIVKAAQARGEVAELGAGLSPEQIWGEGPWGLTREEREAQARRSVD